MSEITPGMVDVACRGYGNGNHKRMKAALEAALAAHDYVAVADSGHGADEDPAVGYRVYGPVTKAHAEQLAETINQFVQVAGVGFILKLLPPSEAPRDDR